MYYWFEYGELLCLLFVVMNVILTTFKLCSSSLPGMTLVTCLATCTVIELLSMWNLTRIEVHLCNMLSPEAPQLSLAFYNWFLVSVFSSLPSSMLYIITVFYYISAFWSDSKLSKSQTSNTMLLRIGFALKSANKCLVHFK